MLEADPPKKIKKRPPRWLRWAIAAPVVVGGFYIFWVAICVGSSNFNVLEGSYAIDSRIAQRLPVNMQVLQRASTLFENAIAWNPSNSTAHQNLALVHRMRISLPKLNAVERKQALDSALEHILKSVSLRPTSGYTYSLVAQIKQMRGERDAVFHKALKQAVQYAPWEPNAQEIVIDVGSRAWKTLDDSEREMVRQTIKRALEIRPKEAQEFLFVRSWVLPSCGDLQIKIPRICK